MKWASMIKMVFLSLNLIAVGLSQAQTNSPANSPKLSVPLLQPSDAVKLAENYLVQIKHIDRNKFHLSHVAYSYLSTVPAPPGVIDVGWAIDFECVPDKLDCRYSVGISNSKTPKIVMYPVH